MEMKKEEMKKEEMNCCVTFSLEDTLEQKLKKAAHVKPSKAQLEWMEKEFIGFIHYSPNTFNHMQWGNGMEKLTDYHPRNLDVAQWCRVCSEAGMKMLVFTAKHHDGFCQWDTKTTDFSSVNSPAATDVVKRLSEGCQENNMELGIYLSPWDMHQRKEGLWPEKEYNEYFLTQLEELLSNYGSVSEVWFDGACSDFEIWHPVPAYEPRRWYELIEKLAPQAVVRLYDPHYLSSEAEWDSIKKGEKQLEWNGKGVRWVGNEGGVSRENEWSVQPVFSREIAENATWKDLGGESYYENAVGAIWYPLEVNTVVLNQWFWNEETSAARSLADLIEVYYNSIGNNGVLLLNVSPDTEGIIREDQRIRLCELKDYVSETFCENVAEKAQIECSLESPGHECRLVLDNDKMTYWTTGREWNIENDTASLTFDLGEEKTFDQVLVREFIREGQRVAGWSLDIWKENAWITVAEHKTIGNKTIRRFKKVCTSKVRFNILRSWDVPMISEFGLYLSAELPQEELKQDREITLLPEKIGNGALEQGLEYHCYDGGIQSAALLESVFAVKEVKGGIAGQIHEQYGDSEIGYSLTFEGYLYVPKTGSYVFELENADGGIVYLAGKMILNHDEPHERKMIECHTNLKQGYYPLKVLYTSFRNQGFVRLRWGELDTDLQDITEEYLYHMC